MNPIKSIGTSLHKSFTYSGRASRSEFWWFQLLRLVAAAAFSIEISRMLVRFFTMSEQLGTAATYPLAASLNSGGMLATSCLVLAFVPASYASGVRRLHDRGHPGWPMWIVFLGAFVQFYVYVLFLIYATLDPVGATNFIEIAVDYLIALASSSEDSAMLFFDSAVINAAFSVAALGMFFAPLFMIYFFIQAILPSKEGENRHGPVPNTPSQTEVFQ